MASGARGLDDNESLDQQEVQRTADQNLVAKNSYSRNDPAVIKVRFILAQLQDRTAQQFKA